MKKKSFYPPWTPEKLLLMEQMPSDDFFLEHVLSPMKEIRNNHSEFNWNEDDERVFLKEYIEHVKKPWAGTPQLIKSLGFFTQTTRDGLRSDILNGIDKLFTLDSLMSVLNGKFLIPQLSSGLTKEIDRGAYKIEEVVSKLDGLTKQNKAMVIEELFMTRNMDNYLFLSKNLPLNETQEKNILEKILIRARPALHLNADKVKNIFFNKIFKNNWKGVDDCIRNLNPQKIELLLNLLVDNKKNYLKESEQIDKAIYLIYDKAIYCKDIVLVEKILETKKEHPEWTGQDIYALMAGRFFSYFKKETAQELFKKMAIVAKEVGDLEYVKEIIAGQHPIVNIKAINKTFNFNENYFRHQMKVQMFDYLNETIEKETKVVKKNKI